MMPPRAAHLLKLVLAIVATAALVLLCLHRSAASTVLGRYSGEYAALLGLLTVNLALAWRALLRAPHPLGGPGPAVPLLLLICGVAVSLMIFVDMVGPSGMPLIHWILLALVGCLLAQTEERWQGHLPIWMRRGMIIVIVIAAAGLLLRAYGITFGLPYPYEVDEHVFVNIAGRIAIDGDLNPRWFGHPGTTTIYALSGIYVLLQHVDAVLGLTLGAEEFQTFFTRNTTLVYLSGRLLMLALSMATIVVAYKLFCRVFGRSTSLLATLLLALSPLHVSYSRIIRTDILSGLIILAVFWLALDLLEKPRWRTYVLAGLLTGVGIATKYPTAIAVLVVLAAHLAHGRHERLSLVKPAVFGGSVMLGAFAASPFLFLDSRNAIADILGESAPEMAGTLLWERSGGWVQDVLWYVREPMAGALSSLGVVLAGIGLVLCFVSRKKDQMLVAGFVPVFIGLIVLAGLRWARWVIPTLPFLCALSAYAVVRGVEAARRRVGVRLPRFAAAILVLGLVWPLLRADLDEGRDLGLPDTRTLAAEWVMSHIPPGSNLVLEANTPFLPRDRYRLYLVNRGGALVFAPPDTADAISGPYRRNHIEQVLFRPYGHIGFLADRDAMARNGIEYMIVGGAYERYAAKGATDPQCATVAARYDSLMARGVQIAEFNRVPGRVRGPRIRVYQLPNRS